MLTFHNDPVQKIKYLTLYRNARESGHMMRGDYFDPLTHKGCLIGLATHGDHHEQFASESGIPEWLLRLGEHFFESLPEASFQEFPETLIDTIPIGVSTNDLEMIKHKLAIFQIEMICCNIDAPLVKDSICQTLSLHKRFINNDPPSIEEWSAAESAAWSARSAARAAWSARSATRSAESAAWSARSATWSARSATRSATRSARAAAWSVAESACSAAESAALSATESAAWSAESALSAAWSAATTKITEKLIELLNELQSQKEEPPITELQKQ